MDSREDLRVALARHCAQMGRGEASDIAREVGVKPARISDFLTGRRMLSAPLASKVADELERRVTEKRDAPLLNDEEKLLAELGRYIRSNGELLVSDAFNKRQKIGFLIPLIDYLNGIRPEVERIRDN